MYDSHQRSTRPDNRDLLKTLLPLHRFIRRDAPRIATIKYWTHAAGACAILLIIPSCCAFYIRYIGLEDHEPGWVRTAYTIWLAHGTSGLLTAGLWAVEKPRLTRYVSTESDLVKWPEDDDRSGPAAR